MTPQALSPILSLPDDHLVTFVSVQAQEQAKLPSYQHS